MTNSRSLVLITVDCLRADYVGFMGYHRPTTPCVDSLARESLVFSDAIVGGAPTYYSFPAILASRYPLALGRNVIGLAPGEPTLATALQKSGYATAAFCAGNPYLSQQLGYQQGFDTFRDFLNTDSQPASTAIQKGNFGIRGRLNRSAQRISRKLGMFTTAYDELYFQYCQRLAAPRADSFEALRRFPAADVIVDQGRAWLASVGQSPFFLWVHLMDPHAPYYPNEKALALMGHQEFTPFRARYLNSYWNRSDLPPSRLLCHRDQILALYDSGIRWVDTQVARLVETLRQFHQWHNCVFVFTADHGEEFLDHHGRYHPPSNMSEEIIRVPLLVRVPGKSKSELPKAPFSHLDLAPTLLEILNLPIPPEFCGKSLWRQFQQGSAETEAAAIVESIGCCTNPFRADARIGARVLAVRENRYKLVLDFDRPHEHLFDLEADPGERTPLPPDAEKPTRRRLLERTSQHLARPLPPQYPRLRLRSRLHDLQIKSPLRTTEPVSA